MSNKHNLKRRKLIGAIFGNLEVIPFDPELDPEPFTCYNCWSDEHFRRDCPEPASHEYCRNCGRRDVEVQDCPRCAKAYRQFLREWQGKEREKRQLSAALYDSRQFSVEEDLCLIDWLRKACGCCDFEVKMDVSLEEYSSAKSLTSEKKKFCEDECWTESDEEEDVYQSVHQASFAKDSVYFEEESDCQSELYESVRDIEFCSNADDLDYQSTRAEFFRECNSAMSGDDLDQESIANSSLSFNDEDQEQFYDSFHATRDAHLNELFAYMRNKKMQDESDDNSVIPLASGLKIPAECKSVYLYEAEDDMDYDDVIVDENERSESLGSEDYAIKEFLDLLDGLKHLPIETQNIAVVHLVSERKKQYWQNQERMLRQCDSEFECV